MEEEHGNVRVPEERYSNNEVLVIQPPKETERTTERNHVTNETCSSRSKQKSLSSRNLSKDTVEKWKSG